MRSRPTGWDAVDADHVVARIGRELGGRDHVDREDDLDTLGPCPLEVAADGVEVVLLQQALADPREGALGGELAEAPVARVGHQQARGVAADVDAAEDH